MRSVLPKHDNVPLASSCLARTGNLDTSGSGSGSTGRGRGRVVPLSLEDTEESLSTTVCLLVTAAGSIAVGLIVRPLAANVVATPALFALLHTRKTVSAAIATVLAFRDGQ